MNPFHERLARIGLQATEKYGFALAGGYAVQAHGLVDRPSEDVDLFATAANGDTFDAAVDSAVDSAVGAYQGQGMHAEVTKRFATFARIEVATR